MSFACFGFFLQASPHLITFALVVTALLLPEEAVFTYYPHTLHLSHCPELPVLAFPAFRLPHSCHLNMRTWSEKKSSTAHNFL